jgi:hypothetical protein
MNFARAASPTESLLANREKTRKSLHCAPRTEFCLVEAMV